MTAGPSASHCYRHPDREAYISCQRCGRMICPQCMTDASVGFQCPECLAEGRKSVREARTVAGGRLPARDGLVSMVLIGINVVVFALQIATGGQSSKIFSEGSLFTGSWMDGSGTIYHGVDDGGWWRLVTSAFLHENILHIAFNMYALFLFGPLVERALGRTRFILTYATLVVSSSTFVYWLTPLRTQTVGASGAIFGLFAIALVLLIKAKQDVSFLIVMLLLNAVLSFQGNVSWEGHLGGFLTGLALGGLFGYAPRARRDTWQVAGFGVLWVAIVVALVLRTMQLS